MTTEPMLDRRLRELMAELAAPGDQSAAIDHVISVTRALRPEPRWRALLKERPMRTSSIVIAGSPPLRFGIVFAVVALIALLAATVVVGALVLRQPALPPAYGPAGNGVLAYAESGDIVTTDAAGSQRTTITTGPAVDSRPVFSRDGTRIAFVSKESGAAHEQVVVVNVDGTGRVVVSPEMLAVHAFDWSPGSDRLAVLGDITYSPAASIVILDAAGGGSAEPIELGDVAPDGWVAWRPPAGDEIVFRGHPTFNDPALALYAVGPGGGTPRILMSPFEPLENVSAIDKPAISPDGLTVTFWTWGPNEAGEVGGWGHILDLDAGTERIASTWGGSTSPISPDGRWVVGAGYGGLVMESADGLQRGRSIGLGLDVNGAELSFSPDGAKIVGRSSSESALDGWFVMDIESGEATPLDVPPDATVSWQRIALP